MAQGLAQVTLALLDATGHGSFQGSGDSTGAIGVIPRQGRDGRWYRDDVGIGGGF